MTTIFLEGTKLVSLPDGNCKIVPDVPETPTTPTVPTTPPIVKTPELKFGSGLPTGETVEILGETFMMQSPGLKHSITKAVNVKAPVYRCEVNKGEIWSNDKTNSYRERAEFYLKGANFPTDKDVWISYGIKIEKGDNFNVSSTDFVYLGQCHASEDKGDVASNPVFGLKFDGVDKLELVTSSATAKIHTEKPKAVSRGIFQVERGVWHQVVIRVKFNPTKGEIQLWLNGKEMIKFSNIGIGYPDTTGPYWKFGIYRSPMNKKLAVSYANMEVSKTESLKDRILNPLAIA